MDYRTYTNRFTGKTIEMIEGESYSGDGLTTSCNRIGGELILTTVDPASFVNKYVFPYMYKWDSEKGCSVRIEDSYDKKKPVTLLTEYMKHQEPKYEHVVYSQSTFVLSGEYTMSELEEIIESSKKRTAALNWSMEKVDKQTNK